MVGHLACTICTFIPAMPDRFQALSATTVLVALAWCTLETSRQNEDYQPFDRLHSRTPEIVTMYSFFDMAGYNRHIISLWLTFSVPT